MKKHILTIILCCGLWTMDCGLLYAQGPPPPPPPPPGPPPGTGAPIDTDVALLFIATAAFGATNIYRKRKSVLVNKRK